MVLRLAKYLRTPPPAMTGPVPNTEANREAHTHEPVSDAIFAV